MTIFRKIVEEFLIEGIDKIQSTSLSYDKGLINLARGLTMFGGRDLDLSEKKRTRLERLKTQIKELPESDDIVTKDSLLDLITSCKHDLLEICTTKNCRTGSTEIAVTDIHTFVTAAYEKICVYLQLNDLPANDNTSNKFKYYGAKACGRSIYEKHFIKSGETFFLSSEKENIILKTLEFSTAIYRTTTAAKKNKPEPSVTKEQYIQLMVERAEYIQREIQRIDNHASNHYVIECMDQAIESFNPPALKAAPEQQASQFDEARNDEETDQKSTTAATI